MRARDFMGPNKGTIVLAEYFASIEDALEGYRALKLYIDKVFDDYQFQFPEGHTLEAKLQHVGRNKAVTAAIVELMTDQMEVYCELCKIYGDAAIRRSQIVKMKYFDMRTKENSCPYTNAELAEAFEVNESTVRRDLTAARKELKLLFFGAQKR